MHRRRSRIIEFEVNLFRNLIGSYTWHAPCFIDDRGIVSAGGSSGSFEAFFGERRGLEGATPGTAGTSGQATGRGSRDGWPQVLVRSLSVFILSWGGTSARAQAMRLAPPQTPPPGATA